MDNLILECKLNEVADDLMVLQKQRQEHLEQATLIEKEMQKLFYKKEALKKEYAQENT